MQKPQQTRAPGAWLVWLVLRSSPGCSKPINTHTMKRTTIIGFLKNQTTFKKAVIEMLEHEIGVITKEVDFHQKSIDAGDDEIPDNIVYDDKTKPTDPIN